MTKHKYQIMAVFIIILVVSSPMLLFYYRTKHVIISEAGDEAKNIAVSIATLLKRDIEAYQLLNSVKDYSTETFDHQYYQEMLSIFQELKSQTGADYIYTEKQVSKDRIAYILDGEPVDSEYFSPIGSTDGVSEEERQVFQYGIPAATDLILYEIWGNHISGFAPIIDPTNKEVIGVVGVDFSAEYVLGIMQEINSVLIILFALIASSASVVAVLLINTHVKRSNQDYLTGLNNRRSFEAALRDMTKQHRKKAFPFSMLVIDIDKFKQINDSYGHAVGDLVLKRVANLLCSNIKESDYLFRYGGDEFVVILPDLNKDQASFVAKRLSDDLSGTNFRIDEDQTIKLSISIGVAEYSSDISVEQLFHDADEAMYEKKKHQKKMWSL